MVAGFDVSEVVSTDLLERRWDRSVDHEVVEGAVPISLGPFEVLTLRMR
ncbi:glycosyl hydrolase-related protein [Kibdelosporangium lantanae]|uniref:Glycosyl hydrolase-related protein n=1 Tax=Kibdelosporangium lantanae TaxID=1497396 RepID=A0ABW3MH20_9PSEU